MLFSTDVTYIHASLFSSFIFILKAFVAKPFTKKTETEIKIRTYE